METAGTWPPDPAWAWDMGEVTFAQVPRENFNRRWIDSRRGGGGGGSHPAHNARTHARAATANVHT